MDDDEALQPEFSVYEFYPDEQYTVVKQFVPFREAILAARDCTRKPAVRLGVIRRVIITDGGDCCVFEWKYGEGVTFPPDTGLE